MSCRNTLPHEPNSQSFKDLLLDRSQNYITIYFSNYIEPKLTNLSTSSYESGTNQLQLTTVTNGNELTKSWLRVARMSGGQLMMEILDSGTVSKSKEKRFLNHLVIISISSSRVTAYNRYCDVTEFIILKGTLASHRAFPSSAICIHKDYKSAAYRTTGTN